MSEPASGGSDRPRIAGHCIVCNAMVERRADGSCPRGHAPAAISGNIELGGGEPLPHLPGFNWGAFLVPPIWGIAHGMWAGVFFLPLWAFVDSAIRGAAGRAWWLQVLAWLTLAGTLAFQFEFARTANRLVWRRACERTTLERYLRTERLWAIGGVIAVGAFGVGIATYFAR